MARKKQQPLVLTPENIQEENKKYEKLKKVKFTTGGYTEIYTFFKPQKIDEMIRDFQDFLSEYEKYSESKIDDDETFYLYFTLHIIKHFSTICPEFPKDFAEKVAFLNKLAEHPCVFELKDAFDPKEVAKVFDRMIKQLEDYEKIMKQNKELQRKLLAEIDKLENKDVIKSVLFGLDVEVDGEGVQKSK